MPETIRVFVGTSPNGDDYEAEAVLAYSLRRFASRPVEIVWMRQATRGPYAGWACATGRTPFSHFRWSLPAMCGYRGRAIYMDVDFVVEADLDELWIQDIPGVMLAKTSATPGGKIKTCCMLVDCEAAEGHVPPLARLKQMRDPQGELSTYFRKHHALVSPYAGEWNVIDLGGFALGDPRVKAIHYSRMEHQLHLTHARARLAAQGRRHWYTGEVFAHPRPELQQYFDVLLREAQDAGYSVDSFGYRGGVEIARRNFTYAVHAAGAETGR